jgi:glucokinase
MSKYCFGVDIGGTSIKIGLFDKVGELLEHWEIPTRKENGGENVLPDVWQAIEKKMEERGMDKGDILGIGLDAPGPVSEDGIIYGCVNMGWGTFHLVEAFQKISGVSLVKACNDAKIAALGEYWKGPCQGCGSMVMVTLGTGVGGGVILDGKIWMGANGAAGEIGHLTILPNEEETCNCGKKGCLEQIASATGIVRVAKKFLVQQDTPSTLRNLPEITAKDVLDTAKEGDGLALEIVEYVCKYLGMALANVCCVVDVNRIIIGGGVSKAGEFLLEKIKKNFNIYAFHSCMGTEISIASLGNLAGIYGCVKMVLEELEKGA